MGSTHPDLNPPIYEVIQRYNENQFFFEAMLNLLLKKGVITEDEFKKEWMRLAENVQKN